jgi:ADP-ribose pyrophosphatase YjhB (NUDIX family)
MPRSHFLPQVSLVITTESQYLLHKPEIAGNVLRPVFPTGNLMPGESLREGALRVAREQTGWEITLTDVLSIHYLGGPIFFNFWAHAPATPQDTLPDSRLIWVSRDRLAALVANDTEENRSFGSPGSLEKAREVLFDQRFPLKILAPFHE